MQRKSPKKFPQCSTADHNSINMSSSSSSSSGNSLPADWYQWPVMLAILPPVMTAYYGGQVEQWSEGFLLLIVGGYLYGLVKVPWELYKATQHRRFWHRLTLALVFLSPLFGILFLRSLVRPHLRVFAHWVDTFPLALYVLTAYIRPLMHLFRVLKFQASMLSGDDDNDIDGMINAEQLLRERELKRDLLERISALEKQQVEMQLQLQAVNGLLEQQQVYIRKILKKERRTFDQQCDGFDERLKQLEKSDRINSSINSRRRLPPGRDDKPLNQPRHSIIWWPVRMTISLCTWWIPTAISTRVPVLHRLLENTGGSHQPTASSSSSSIRPRASITMEPANPEHHSLTSLATTSLESVDSTVPLSSLESLHQRRRKSRQGNDI